MTAPPYAHRGRFAGDAWWAVDGEDVLGDALVVEALASLSRAHREILTETVIRRRTIDEAADALGLPVGTAKVRVYYALRALRIVLEERGVAP